MYFDSIFNNTIVTRKVLICLSNMDLMQMFWLIFKAVDGCNSTRYMYSRIPILWLILYTIFNNLIFAWWCFKWKEGFVVLSINYFSLYHFYKLLISYWKLCFHFQHTLLMIKLKYLYIKGSSPISGSDAVSKSISWNKILTCIEVSVYCPTSSTNTMCYSSWRYADYYNYMYI